MRSRRRGRSCCGLVVLRMRRHRALPAPPTASRAACESLPVRGRRATLVPDGPRRDRRGDGGPAGGPDEAFDDDRPLLSLALAAPAVAQEATRRTAPGSPPSRRPGGADRAAGDGGDHRRLLPGRRGTLPHRQPAPPRDRPALRRDALGGLRRQHRGAALRRRPGSPSCSPTPSPRRSPGPAPSPTPGRSTGSPR